MKRTVLADRQFVWRHPAEYFGGRANVRDRLRCVLAQGFENSCRTLNVRVIGVERGLEAGLWIALRCEVKHIIRTNCPDHVVDGLTVPQIAIVQEHSITSSDVPHNALEVVERAAPANQAVKLPCRVLEKIIGQMGSHHSCNARNERPCHKFS